MNIFIIPIGLTKKLRTAKVNEAFVLFTYYIFNPPRPRSRAALATAWSAAEAEAAAGLQRRWQA